jgi:hypothetical protein
MKNNTLLMTMAIGLILFGVIKPDISQYLPSNNSVINSNAIENYVVDAPQNDLLLEKAKVVKNIISNGPSSRAYEGKKLSSLYYDLAILISLTGSDEVVRNTEEIRQANSLAGIMLKLGIKDKYKDLSGATEDLVISYVGKDDILLDDMSRGRAVEAFRALSWACYEGSK